MRRTDNRSLCAHIHTAVQYVLTTEAANDHNSLQTQPGSEPPNERVPLRRVKRKGIGSFFGARSKATPNTWDGNVLPGQNPNYGAYPASNFDGTQNHPEENLYYLIVAAISFGVVVYCCYQCKPHTRGDELDVYRARHLESARQRHQRLQQQNADDSALFDGVLNDTTGQEGDQFKASAPPLTSLVRTNDTDRYRTATIAHDTASQPINPNGCANGGLYPTDQPPTYEQAIQFDAARRQQTGQH